MREVVDEVVPEAGSGVRDPSTKPSTSPRDIVMIRVVDVVLLCIST